MYPANSAVIRPQVVIVEDQRLVAESVASVLRQEAQAEVLGLFASIPALLDAPEILAKANLLLLDLHLEEGHPTLGALRDLRRRRPGLRCMWLSGAVTDAALRLILDAKLEGFVHKDDPTDELIEAVRVVLGGRSYFSRTAKRLAESLRGAGDSFAKILSPRELEVLALIGGGLGNEEIAALLGMSASTAQTHRRNIMAKLELNSTVALQVYAQQKGFVALRGRAGAARAAEPEA